MSLPARAIFSREYFPPHFKVAAERLMESAFDFAYDKLKKTFKKPEFVAGFPSLALEHSFLDKVYENLTLCGNESLFTSYQKMWKFQRFMEFIDLDRDELEAVKITQTDGRKVFSCSMVRAKVLCELEKIQIQIHFHS